MMHTRRPHGFTLVEIMVAVGIIGIVMSLIMVATLQVRVRSRDSKRISDVTTIMNALESYYAANRSYPTMITAGEPFLVGSTTILPKIPSNPFPRTDGGCTNSDYIYTTTTTGYQLTTCLGAKHGRFDQGTLVCKNGNCGIKDDCTGEITDAEGIRYPIIRIGEQCWMATHLKSQKNPNNSCINHDSGYIVNPDCLTTYASQNYGGFGGCPAACVPGSRRDCIKTTLPIYGPGQNQGWDDRGKDVLSSAYDYPPVSTLSACNLQGALYTWAGAMALSDEPWNTSTDCNYVSCSGQITSPHRGICPAGWHIPTDVEFHTLETTLTDVSKPCDPARNSHALGQDSCQSAGTALASGGTSGFNAILLGFRTAYNGTSFVGINQSVHFWTATVGTSPSQAISRSIDVGISGTYRESEAKENALAIRCIRDY